MSPIRVFDKYEIIRRLTSGGMGDIFLARQVGVAGFQRLVILKSLRPELVENEDLLAQFLNEARTVARLNHPNIVAVLEVDEYRGVFFIALEYIEGADLTALLGEARRLRQPIPFRVSAGIVHDTAMGLAHAHAARDDEGRTLKLVHRDISPANVMVRRDGISKVLDFGIATMTGSGPLRGVIQGKYRYMSPEQALGRELTPSSDQYSLGVVLWELCTQRRLIADGAPREILRHVVEAKIPPPSKFVKDIPRELEATILRMLQREASDRYPTCKQVVDALRAYLDASGGPADRHVERVLEVLLGEAIALRTADLTLQEVSIPGLLQAADVSCPSCQFTNQLRHRYCTQCGAPLAAAPFENSPPKPERTPAPAKLNRQSVQALLLARGAELQTRTLVTREVPAVVVAARVHGRQRAKRALSTAAGRNVDQRLIRIFTSTAEAFAAAVIRLTAEELVLGFSGARSPGDDALRALRCATELQEEVRRAARAQGLPLAVSIALARGKMQLGGASLPRDGGVTEATEVAVGLAARDLAGVFAVDTLANTLENIARFSTVQDSKLRRLDYVVGENVGERIELVGRTLELARVRVVLGECAEGQARSLLFLAGPGAGKTRMLDESAVAASKRGFVIAHLDCAGNSEEETPELLPKILSAIGREAGFVRDRWGEKSVLRIAELGVGPATIGRAFVAVRKPEQFAAASVRDRSAIEAALREVILALTALRPVLVLVDDLHLAPPDLWDGLKTLYTAGRSLPIAMICTADSTAHGTAREMPKFIAESIALDALSDDKILKVAQAFAHGLPLPPVAAQIVLERAGGNPGAARLVIESLVAGGGLERTGDHWTATPELTKIDLAAHFRELLKARIDQLEPSTRSFLELGAVAGLIFDATLIAAASENFGENLGENAGAESAIELASATGLVARVDVGNLSFVQPSYRDALLEHLHPDAVRSAHERLGRALLAAGGSPPGIATHLLSGEAKLDAVELALGAAVQLGNTARAAALVRGAFRACADRLDAGEAPTPSLRAALAEHAGVAVAILAAHDIDEAVALYGSIEKHVAAWIDPRTEALFRNERAKLHLRQGRLQDADRDLRRALELARSSEDRALLARILAASAEVHETRGELDAAVTKVLESLRISEDIDTGQDFLWTQSNALGRLYLRMNDTDRAEELFDLAHQQATQAESERGQAAALMNRASVSAKRGRTDQALELLAEAIHFAGKAGDTVGFARAQYNRGRILAHQKRAEEARDALRESVKAAVEGGWTEGEAVARRALEALADQARSR